MVSVIEVSTNHPLRRKVTDQIHVMTNLDCVEDILLQNRTQNIEKLRIPRKSDIRDVHLLIHSPHIFFPRQKVVNVNTVISMRDFPNALVRTHDDQ